MITADSVRFTVIIATQVMSNLGGNSYFRFIFIELNLLPLYS